jgi:DNA-binding transcriptional LysR family regulator
MDLNKIAVFVRVVETQSFTAAARALGVPKSSVSRSVAQLEQDLGVRLLHRTTRKLHLTDAGAAYYDKVSRALAGVQEATAAVSDMEGAERGAVRLTAPVDVGVFLLGRLLARFARRHPGVRVELSLTSRVVDLVEEGFDLALRAGRLRDSSLVRRRLATLEAALFCSPGYARRRGVPQTLADLADHDAVVFRANDGKASWRLQGPKGEESVTVSGPLAVDDFLFVRKAVLAGMGVGLLPAFLCHRDAERGRAVRVLPGWAARGSPLHLVYPPGRYVPRRVALLRDFLVEQIAEHPAARCTGSP